MTADLSHPHGKEIYDTNGVLYTSFSEVCRRKVQTRPSNNMILISGYSGESPDLVPVWALRNPIVLGIVKSASGFWKCGFGYVRFWVLEVRFWVCEGGRRVTAGCTVDAAGAGRRDRRLSELSSRVSSPGWPGFNLIMITRTQVETVKSYRTKFRVARWYNF